MSSQYIVKKVAGICAIAGSVIAIAGVLVLSGVCAAVNVHPAWVIEGETYAMGITMLVNSITGFWN